MKKVHFISTFILLFASVSTAQTYTEILEHGWGNMSNTSKPAFIDLDDDNKLDLIVGEFQGALNHYEQEEMNSTHFIRLPEIIEEGETFSPEYDHCSGERATYSVPVLLTGYTAVGTGEDEGTTPEYACESDSDCGECEYCSIANDACLPVEGCGEEELPPEEEPECTTNSDCPAGSICKNLECVE